MIKTRTRILAIVLIFLSCMVAISGLILFNQKSMHLIVFSIYMLFSLYMGIAGFGLSRGSKLAWWLLYIQAFLSILANLAWLVRVVWITMPLKIPIILGFISLGFWIVVLVLLLTDNPKKWKQVGAVDTPSA